MFINFQKLKQSGQNCIGIQRLLVHASIYEEFKRRFVEGTVALKAGNPALPETDVGPMVTVQAAARAKAVVDAALAQGAILLCGNVLDGAVYTPTVLEGVKFESALWKREVFAPVVVL